MEKNTQKGFTLIELIMVIVILGILAAFAIPRYVSLQTDARISAVNGLAGGLRAAAAIAHSQLAVNTTGCTGSVLTMEGVGVNVTACSSAGYPTSQGAGIGKAAGGDANGNFSGFTLSGGTTANGTISYQSTGATTPASCVATYDMSGTAPTVTTTTSGC